MGYSEIAQFIGALSPILLVVYIIFREWRSGTSTLRKDINSDYVERNRQLEEKLKDVEDRLNEVSLQMGKLEATLIEKDKHIANITKIIENRNPDLLKVLDEIKTFMKNLNELMIKTNNTSSENSGELHYQTSLLNRQAKRDENIDDASATGEGNPIRINT